MRVVPTRGGTGGIMPARCRWRRSPNCITVVRAAAVCCCCCCWETTPWAAAATAAAAAAVAASGAGAGAGDEEVWGSTKVNQDAGGMMAEAEAGVDKDASEEGGEEAREDACTGKERLAKAKS